MMNENKNKTIYIALLSLGLVVFLIVTLVIINKKITVFINTKPSGASFKVGSEEGKTPTKIKLKPGNYKISLSMDGFKPQDTSFKVKPLTKDITLSYILTPVKELIKPSQEAIDTNFGAGKPDPNWQAKLETIKKKYSFYNDLPFRGQIFYIGKPTYDDKFFIYIPKENPSAGKVAVKKWFSKNGIKDISKLNIIWQYGRMK